MVSKASRNHDSENREYNEDRSQNGPHPVVGSSGSRSPHSVNSDLDAVLPNNFKNLSLFFPLSHTHTHTQTSTEVVSGTVLS